MLAQERFLARKMLQYIRHRRRHPAVSAGPAERNFIGVIVKSVIKLNAVEKERRLARGAVEINVLSGREIRLKLKERDHIRIIDPKTRLICVAHVPPLHAHRHRLDVIRRRRIVGLRLFPLHIGIFKPQFHRPLVAV